MNIDKKIKTNWEKGKQLHDDNVSVQLPGSLQELIETLDNKQQLQEELKELVMEWFWNGYYKGFSSK